MKKVLAIIILIVLMISIWWIGYNETHNAWTALLMIPACAVFGGLGGFLGIFIMNTLFDKK